MNPVITRIYSVNDLIWPPPWLWIFSKVEYLLYPYLLHYYTPWTPERGFLCFFSFCLFHIRVTMLLHLTTSWGLASEVPTSYNLRLHVYIHSDYMSTCLCLLAMDMLENLLSDNPITNHNLTTNSENKRTESQSIGGTRSDISTPRHSPAQTTPLSSGKNGKFITVIFNLGVIYPFFG